MAECFVIATPQPYRSHRHGGPDKVTCRIIGNFPPGTAGRGNLPLRLAVPKPASGTWRSATFRAWNETAKGRPSFRDPSVTRIVGSVGCESIMITWGREKPR
jgi:uncharacterized protein (DUF2236 family)